MYLSRNYRPEIQFVVQLWYRLTHNPRRSHSEAVNRIYRRLVGTQWQGLTLNPNSDMNMYCYVDAYFAGLLKHEDDQDLVCGKLITG